jgi:hypothetical protein
MSCSEALTWLRAQIAAAKAAAEAAARCAEVKDGHWYDEEDEVTDDNGWRIASSGSPAVIAYIALDDPRNGIADCEAKLAILEHCEGALQYPANGPLASLARRNSDSLLAAYRNRAGFKPEWIT